MNNKASHFIKDYIQRCISDEYTECQVVEKSQETEKALVKFGFDGNLQIYP